MKSFVVQRPKDLPEVLTCLGKAQGETKILAGGTDLVIQLREGSVNPDTVIDISDVPELKNIKEEEGLIKIGAACSFTEIAESEIVQKYGLCLAQAASEVGSEQIRNAGTIGGNIANASPAADSMPALVVLDAWVTVLNARGEAHQVPVCQMSAGVGKNKLDAKEIITEITFPIHDFNWRTAFCKLGRRKALVIARINMAVAVEYDEGLDLIKDARVALGAVGTVAFRSSKAEQVLVGSAPSPELKDKFAQILSAVVEESIPNRSSMPYKKEAVQGVAYDIFDKLFPPK